MNEQRLWPRPTSLLATLGGPAILGAVIGLPFGLPSLLQQSLTLPAIVLGLALLMAPALYIGLSLLGQAPPARKVADAVGGGLRSCGIVLGGLAPATAFMFSTTEEPLLIYGLATLVVAGGVLIGIQQVFGALFPSGSVRGRAVPLFVAWAVVSMLLGGQLLLSALPTHTL